MDRDLRQFLPEVRKMYENVKADTHIKRSAEHSLYELDNNLWSESLKRGEIVDIEKICVDRMRRSLRLWNDYEAQFLLMRAEKPEKDALTDQEFFTEYMGGRRVKIPEYPNAFERFAAQIYGVPVRPEEETVEVPIE